MQEWLIPYAPTVWAMGVVAALFLVQILVVDFTSIRMKHAPGTPVPANHDDFLFRAVRAHANTNEGIAGFILLSVFGILSSASPPWLNGLAWVYVLGRVGHMLCYYADKRTLRSVSFALALAALIAMLLAGVMPWLD